MSCSALPIPLTTVFSLYPWKEISPISPHICLQWLNSIYLWHVFSPFTPDTFSPSFVYNDFTPFISNMKSLSLTLTRSFSLHPWHKFMKYLLLTRTRSYSLYLYHEVSFLPLTWDFFLTSDMSLKLASSFSLSCCRSLMFCSCMSSNAWPVTSISLSRASSLCTITLIGRTKNIMQQNEFWTAHLLKNHKRL